MTSDAARNAIYTAIRSIPAGQVASYGAVAARAGLPGRARLVGRLLRESAASAKLPWHRVLRSDGALAFPPESDMHEKQAGLLRGEGVELVAGRVPSRLFVHAEQELDTLLWGPPGE